MSLVIKNASLLLGKNLDYIDIGFIEVGKDGIIKKASAAKYESNDNYKFLDILDAEGYLIVPGFINAHTHIGDSIGKDMATDRGLEAVHPMRGIKKKILEKPEDREVKSYFKMNRNNAQAIRIK